VLCTNVEKGFFETRVRGKWRKFNIYLNLKCKQQSNWHRTDKSPSNIQKTWHGVDFISIVGASGLGRRRRSGKKWTTYENLVTGICGTLMGWDWLTRMYMLVKLSWQVASRRKPHAQVQKHVGQKWPRRFLCSLVYIVQLCLDHFDSWIQGPHNYHDYENW